jgi:hypothetical protein
MSKKILIDTLFTQFTDFIKQLENMYPHDTDFPIFLTTLQLLKSANPMLVVNFVKTDIIDPYGQKIISKDESFFLEQDYTKHGADVDLNVVNKLKKYIQNMSPNSKDIVWKYIELLMKLTLKILEN